MLSKVTRYSPAGATRFARSALSPPPGQLPPPPQARFARRPRGSFRTASSRFPGQRLPTTQRATRRLVIGWRCQGRARTFRPRFKNLARKAGLWPAPPLSSAGLERGQTRARNLGTPPLPLARPLPSARELSSSLRGPRRSERRETAAAAAALPSALPVPGRPGAAPLGVPLTCQFASRLERAESERGLLGTSSPLRLQSPASRAVSRSLCRAEVGARRQRRNRDWQAGGRAEVA